MTGCAPKRVNSIEDHVPRINRGQVGHSSAQIFSPEGTNASRLRITGMEISLLHKDQHQYPFIRFHSDPNRDYVEYRVCQASRCQEGITAGSSVLVPALFVGTVDVRMRPCLRKGYQNQAATDKRCGPFSEKKLTLPEKHIQNKEETDRLLRKRHQLTQDLYRIGKDYIEALNDFEQGFPSCLTGNPETIPVISEQTLRDFKALGPYKLGYALIGFDQQKFHRQMERQRQRQQQEAGTRSKEKGNEGSVGAERILFGVMGLAAGAGTILGSVSTDITVERPAVDGKKSTVVQSTTHQRKYIMIGAGVLSAAAGAIMTGLGMNELLRLSRPKQKDTCEANEEMRAVFEKTAVEAGQIREELEHTDRMLNIPPS